MAFVTINTDNRNTYPLNGQVLGAMVWTKPTWASEWVQRDDLFPLGCSWKAHDELAGATLHYRYGEVLLPGYPETQVLSRITVRGYYVLIAWGTHDGIPLYWLGFAESPITLEHVPARDGQPDTGVQTIPCFGLGRALEETWITSTVFENPDPPDPPDDIPKRTFGGAVFNRGNRGNRSAEKLAFEGGLDGYVFTNPDADGEWWSSRDIVEHLFAFHLPTPEYVKKSGGIPWTMTGVSAIPNWDRPVIETDGANVSQILSQLLSPDRLLNWTIGANATFVDYLSPPTISQLRIELFTHTPTAISLPAFGNVPANTNQISLTCQTDPKTKITVTEDESDVVDQLIVRGPHEIGIGTFTYEEFEDDWDPNNQGTYDDGGKNSAGWSALRKSVQRERNEAVRGKRELSKVYRVWRLKKDWDGCVEGFDVERLPIFKPEPTEDEEAEPTKYVPFLGAIEFLETMPLYSGIDYTKPIDEIDESGSRVRLKPIFMIENPKSSQLEDFTRTSKLLVGFRDRDPNAIPITLAGGVDNEFGPRYTIDVSGGPQHAIAKDFTPNIADVPQKRWGEYDYEKVKITLAVKNDRRPYVTLPTSVTADVVRRKIITIEHPSLEMVYLAENTIVGFDDTGEPEYHSEGGILRDPSDMLRSITAMLAAHYLQPRRRCVIETGWRLSSMQIGSILTNVSQWPTAVNSPIIEISIQNPLQNDSEAVSPTMTIIAAAQRFDPMALLVPVNEDLLEAELR